MIYHTKDNRKIKSIKKFLSKEVFALCAAVIMIFFGSLYFSYSFSAADVETDAVKITVIPNQTAADT